MIDYNLHRLLKYWITTYLILSLEYQWCIQYLITALEHPILNTD